MTNACSFKLETKMKPQTFGRCMGLIMYLVIADCVSLVLLLAAVNNAAPEIPLDGCGPSVLIALMAVCTVGIGVIAGLCMHYCKIEPEQKPLDTSRCF